MALSQSESSSVINVKTLTDLTNLIFRHDGPKKSIEKLENAKQINGYDLFTYFPPKFHDPNKKALFDEVTIVKKYIPSKERDVLITRFHPFHLPTTYNKQQHTTTTG